MNDDDLKGAWQGQPITSEALPLAALRAGAVRVQRRVALRNALEYLACFGVVAYFVVCLAIFPFPWMRAGSVLLILGTLFVAWQLRDRAAAAPLPREWGERPWLDFHREQLERQRDALRSAWLWYVAPFVPGVIAFRWGVETELGASAAFARGLWTDVSIAAVFAAVIVLNRYAAHRCQRRLDALLHSASQ
jgi:hypothetical protein